MKTTLVIMAAGLGSRYGGNKQVDGIGPNGEILMQYSIYDAIRAGFNKIVFIIKEASSTLSAVPGSAPRLTSQPATGTRSLSCASAHARLPAVNKFLSF